MAIEMKRDVSFLEVFNRTHKRLAGHGDFIDNKSKSASEMYNSILSQKYEEDSFAKPEFDPHAWTEAIGRMETTRTHAYGLVLGCLLKLYLVEHKAMQQHLSLRVALSTLTVTVPQLH
ncbi:uncharacterized protein LOC110424886 isoform X2 [Herrania umbratica]|uniref:Uncharacterized protein LOC110424886 isoform X2 n=1 Tax=Herrania umbratica TaxID=108875 RepID=A0A6J1B7S6_9ROSI|nr:uncharacterized protein LOC110424886 isoform X2 [Herrania umbratica]